MRETDVVKWDDILAKLAGIKALADRGGTLAEAEAAAMMMAKFLFRYNLTLLDVERHVTESGRAVTSEEIVTTTAGWRRFLLNAVAQGHLCRAVCNDGTTTVVGHAHNLLVVRAMFLWLADEVNRLCELAYRDAVAEGDWGAIYHGRSWKNGFRLGAVVGITRSYQTMLRDAEREATEAEWALIPLMGEEVDTLVGMLFPTLQRLAPPGIGIAGGFAAGEAAGAAINLQRQIHGTGSARALSRNAVPTDGKLR
jgi:hypothetical protein